MNENFELTLTQKAHKLKKQLEQQKLDKALELVKILDENPKCVAMYDWYKGIDTQIDMEYIRYILVSRFEIKEIKTTGSSIHPEPEEFQGYLKYDFTTIVPVTKIKTESYEFPVNAVI